MKTKFKTEVKPSIPKSLAFEKLNKAYTLVWDCLNYEGIDSVDSTALMAILNGLRQQVNTVREHEIKLDDIRKEELQKV